MSSADNVLFSGENPFPWSVTDRGSKICGLAAVQKAEATYGFGHVFIRVEGQKPNPCYQITIERSPIDIFPPQFIVRACIDAGRICPQIVVPYRVVNVFASGPLKELTLKTAGGDMTVQVKQLPVPAPPGPASTDVSSVISMPLRLDSVFEGNAKPAIAKPREATGYSDTFSFEKAFGDAVRNLPPPEETFPDQLTTVTVTSIGALFGGIVGFNKMFVKVRAI
jgi:hypothetical protein